tara:strand:+ start:2031 stop:2903 length:873 start_codon:yes stop_codon:yes gene_type:complete
MKIILTGGTGFIGSRILSKLTKFNHEILILSRKKIKSKRNVKYIQCDLFKPNSYLDKIKKFKPHILIHCAWYDIENLNKKENSSNNLKYSKFLINKVIKLKSLKKILIAGSCFEIKNKKNKVSEKCSLNVMSHFARAKTSLLKHIKKVIKKNQKFYWLRIFYAYGPGNRDGTIIPMIIKNLKDNKPFVIKNPKNELDYIYVEDIADYFIKILLINPKSGIYNVSSGKLTSIKFIFRFLKSKINRNYKFHVFGKSKKNLSYYGSTKKSFLNLYWKPQVKINSGLSKTIRKL